MKICRLVLLFLSGGFTTVSAQTYTFSTFATGFFLPNGVAVDDSGNVFVADEYNCTIRQITAAGVVTTVAGLAGSPQGSADGTGSAARFELPRGVAIDGNGNLFVADSGNHKIRKITAGGVVTTLAGLAGTEGGGSGSADGTGSAARFNSPSGIAVDRSGIIYVADTSNHTIRKIVPGGTVTTLAGLAGTSGGTDGTGSSARFSLPSALAVDASGNLYVADSNNNAIRKITADGVVTTLAGMAGTSGSADGTGSAARFRDPRGVAVDSNGTVFVSDSINSTIRKITATGIVTTLAGTVGSSGSANGPGSAARFLNPSGLAVDRSGNLYVADSNNHTIRKGVPAESAPSVSRLVNLSTRGLVAAGGDLTVGFVIRGSGAKSLLVRAVGPTLGSFGVDGTLADPRLDVFPAGTSVASHSNDDWAGDATLAQVFSNSGAFALPTMSKDSALVASLTVAGYSARITSSVTGGSGLALAEVHDRDAMGTGSRLINVSTLGFVGTGAQALTPGFVIDGAAPKLLLIRAVGPGLAAFGVGGTLADPQLAIIPLGQSFTIAGNDNWNNDASLGAAFTAAGAFALPTSSKDAAVVVNLPPGGYTVTVSGVADTTGRALVEIYDLDP